MPEMKGFHPLSKATVQVVVKQGIDIDDLDKLMREVVGLSGCTRCGLLGFDLRILLGDPASERLHDIKGVQSVSVLEH